MNVKHDVAEMYKVYQSRRKSNSTGENEVAAVANPVAVTTAILGTEADQHEQQIEHLYRSYKINRDNERDAIFSQVMVAVREHIKQNHTVSTLHPAKIVAHSSFLDRLYLNWHSNWVRILSQAQNYRWQIASVTAVLLLVTTLPLLNQKAPASDHPTYIAAMQKIELQPQIVTDRMPPFIYPTLGFSTKMGLEQIAFSLGTLSIDLSILAKTQENGKLLALTGEMRQLLKQIPHESLSVKMTNLDILLQQAANKPLIQREIQETIQVIDAHFLEKNNKIYPLGQWLELTLLVLPLSESGSATLLTGLLGEIKRVSIEAQHELIQVPGFKQIFEELLTLSVEIPPENSIRKLALTLQKMKAVLL